MGDGALDTILGAMTARGLGPVWRGRRTRIEHGDLLFPGNFPRLREVGAMSDEPGGLFAMGISG